MHYLSLLVVIISVFSFAEELESVPTNEAQAIQTVKNIISGQVRAEAQKTGKAVRDAHAKAHGCVAAEFHVNDNLPSLLQTTVFKPGATYPTWIRFSNGSGKSQDDNEGDGRGMAMKLTGVPGDKLGNEINTQDFLMINHPTFFVRNASDYVEFSQATAKGNPLPFFFPSFNPLSFRLHELSVARKIQRKNVSNLLKSPYWTMTPSLYNDRAVKFMVRPIGTTSQTVANPVSPSYLRDALRQSLLSGSASFEFFVQFQTNTQTMPVEDPTIEWSEEISRPIKVATISIRSQRFESPEQQRFCENLSMNPWHSVSEHRPLGGINRTRKVVYDTISELRHEINKEKPIEPTGNERF